MDRDKKETILNEIDQWRQGRLLPEHYCDFLENLYRDDDIKASRNILSLRSLQQGNWKSWMFSFVIISFFFFIVIYFSFFAWPLQIGVIMLITSACYAISAYYRRQRELLSLTVAGSGSLLMLLLGSWMIQLQGWSSSVAPIVFIASCGTVWLVVGFFLRFGLLEYCGIACMMLLYALLFHYLHPAASWGILQLLWLPLSILFFWFTWLSHHWLKRMARVLFAISLTLWFMPEMDGLLLRQYSAQGMELWMVVKLLSLFVILFGFRKKWVEWLSS